MAGSFLFWLSLCLCVAVVLTESITAALPGPIVDLGYAVHQATRISNHCPYLNFSNIRYAEPPLNNLRFAAPIPPQTFNRTLNDGQQGAICPQAVPSWEPISFQFLKNSSLASVEILETQYKAILQSPLDLQRLATLNAPLDPRTTEDCLLLDVIVSESVFESSLQNKERAAVLVWIYGGGYVTGDKTGAGIDPAGLLAQSQRNGGEGVVFVAMNYRLGVFGWQSGPTFQQNGTANAGLLDQRLALEWVQKYIHLFGGDRNRVTIIGESAGGGSAMHHITAYGGKSGPSPFQQAIAQSPAFQPLKISQQESIHSQVLGIASFLANKSVTTTQQLRQLPYSTLYETNLILVGNSTYGGFTFSPAVDGIYVPALPGQLLLDGQFDKSIKIIAGHNSNEGVLFASPFVQTEKAYIAFLESYFPNLTASVLNTITQVLYPPVYNGSSAYSSQFGRTALTYAEFNINCNRVFMNAAQPSVSYGYLFNLSRGLHAGDIEYTFYNGNRTTSLYGLPINGTLAHAFQQYIVDFTMGGSPNSRQSTGLSFPIYGEEKVVIDVDNVTFGLYLKDADATARCSFWQAAPYF